MRDADLLGFGDGVGCAEAWSFRVRQYLRPLRLSSPRRRVAGSLVKVPEQADHPIHEKRCRAGLRPWPGVRWMLRVLKQFFAALAMGGLLCARPTAAADAADAAELVARIAEMAPAFDTDRASFRSFQVKGKTVLALPFGDVGLAFDCAVEAVGKRACVISADGMPVFIALDARVLIYDPYGGAQEYTPAGWYLKIAQVADRFVFVFGVGGEIGATIDIDLRSLVSHASESRAVEQLAAGRYRFTGWSRNRRGQLEVKVDGDHAPRYESLRITADSRNIFEMTGLIVDAVIPSTAFRFPELRDAVGQAPILIANSQSVAEDGARRVVRGVLLRKGMNDPGSRAAIESLLGPDLRIDWDDLTRRDAKVGAAVKSVVTESRHP
jgi:hypothetical protein